MSRPPLRPGIPPGNTYASSALLQTSSNQNRLISQDRIRFGNQELIASSNISFKPLAHVSLSKEEKCLLDNLWISYNKNPKEQKYFLACMNALSEHFSQNKNKFKFYVVIKGKTLGIFHTWLEVLESINNFKDPLFKGFTNFQEALDSARQHIGLNFYISPSLKNYQDPPLDFSPSKDKKIFCTHCECMQNNFKVINEANQTLITERTSLQKRITSLEKEVTNLRMTYPKGTTEPKKSVASPVQTVTGKDSSNPLMAVDLPKIQQTQGTVDFPTNQTQQTNPEKTEIWDTLGEPSGKFSSSAEHGSPDKGKEIMQDSQDPEDDIVSINRLLSQIQKLQDTPEKSKKFPRQKKKAVKKKKEDIGKKFEIAINKALERVFHRKEDDSEKEIKECHKNPSPENSQADDEEFGEDEHLGTNNSDSGMSFSPTAQHNLDT
ncbi:Uncharacterized protein Adt_44751 [Abeliophyllum distichum]|uniref:Ribonuclease H1 N-terminal domain-containing protein n=1 Tax=Abeliophyllum distichum TaxID=126358 RepID=A0ABD1PBR8_9LAMI